MDYLKSTGNTGVGTAIIYGLMFGVVLIAAFFIVSVLLKASGASSILVGILIFLAVGFLAGLVASRRTNKWITGNLAALISGLFASLLVCIAVNVSNGFSIASVITIIVWITIFTGAGGFVGGYVATEQ